MGRRDRWEHRCPACERWPGSRSTGCSAMAASRITMAASRSSESISWLVSFAAGGPTPWSVRVATGGPPPLSEIGCPPQLLTSCWGWGMCPPSKVAPVAHGLMGSTLDHIWSTDQIFYNQVLGKWGSILANYVVLATDLKNVPLTTTQL